MFISLNTKVKSEMVLACCGRDVTVWLEGPLEAADGLERLDSEVA
jgi:hypothetical protein